VLTATDQKPQDHKYDDITYQDIAWM